MRLDDGGLVDMFEDMFYPCSEKRVLSVVQIMTDCTKIVAQLAGYNVGINLLLENANEAIAGAYKGKAQIAFENYSYQYAGYYNVK